MLLTNVFHAKERNDAKKYIVMVGDIWPLTFEMDSTYSEENVYTILPHNYVENCAYLLPGVGTFYGSNGWDSTAANWEVGYLSSNLDTAMYHPWSEDQASMHSLGEF